jgi:hypothetical protein
VDSETSKCHYAFPPQFSIEDLISKSFGKTADATAKAVIASWKHALAADAPSTTTLGTYQRSHKSYVNLSRLAAAAIVISLVYTFACLVLYIIFRPKVAERYTQETTGPQTSSQYMVLTVEGRYKEVGTDRVIELRDGSTVRSLQVQEVNAELAAKGQVSLVTVPDPISIHTSYHWRFTRTLWLVAGAAVVDFLIVLAAVLASANAVMAGPGAFENTAVGQGRVMLVFSLIGRIMCLPIVGAVLFVIAVVVAYFLFMWFFIVLDWMSR